MLTPIPQSRVGQHARTNRFREGSFQDFSGGLFVTENQININPKYSTVMDNVFINENNNWRVRWGTKEFATASADIVNMVYFSNTIVAFLNGGDIQAINEAGEVVTIWSDAIADALPGNPDGWTTTLDDNVTVESFRGELHCYNGHDKPVYIRGNLTVDYVQDQATGSNINTPSGQHLCAVNSYMAVAGGLIPDPFDIYFSSFATASTFAGDPAPNTAVVYNIGSYAKTAEDVIRGMFSFSTYLFVLFSSYTVIITVGETDESGNHVPTVFDVIEDVGAFNNNCVFKTDKNVYLVGRNGMFTIARDIYNDKFTTKRISEDLGTRFSSLLSSIDIDTDRVFISEDKIERRFFLHIEQEDNHFDYCLSILKEKTLRWSTVSGWDFSSATSTKNNRLFFAKGAVLWQYGNSGYENEAYTTDFIPEAETDFSEGTPIDFEWETPWVPLGQRLITKEISHITADTRGKDKFLISVFVDGFYTTNEDGSLSPQTSIEMTAGETDGYGSPSKGFGGGRKANNEHFIKFPLKFKLVKFRCNGASTQNMSMIGIFYLYRSGGFKR